MAQGESQLQAAIDQYGVSLHAKLNSVAVQGQPEDQLRAPVESLATSLAAICGLAPSRFALIGESSLKDLKTRPDYAVTYENLLLGFIEIKAPGKGSDPRKFKDAHDKDQWKKLKALPNLIYTDGASFSLWRDGNLVGKLVKFSEGIGPGAPASQIDIPAGLLSLFESFFSWEPIAPTSPQGLADVSARLCRILRDEVREQVESGDPTLVGLLRDWRQLLFPEATPAQFADSYAQAVTFGLLLARSQNIGLEQGVGFAAKKLAASTHSLIGAALRVLTDAVVETDVLATSVSTISRVFAVVDWQLIAKENPDAWLYFYEHFLEEYDNDLRKRTGSYYTPVEVVTAMTRIVHEALQGRLAMESGLADPRVTVVDPAMGTGTFLLEVIRRISAQVTEEQGEGAVPAAIADAMDRLIGFELQLGPFAVAQLRVLAELREAGAQVENPKNIRMYVTNTIDNPYVEEQTLGTWYEPIAESRREANKIKRDVPVLVVLGNPPYKDKSRGKGGWIEKGSPGALDAAPLNDFIPPRLWGVGAHSKHLYNPYVYFWRWATWKVFDAHAEADQGVVCFITPAGFVDGLGFQRMREYLRQKADAIWVVDCSPEGFLPPTSTRIFEDVKHQVCITIAVRDGSTGDAVAAPVRYRSLAAGARQSKFAELATIGLADDGWKLCRQGWRDPFIPPSDEKWVEFPHLDDLLRRSRAGTLTGRTWVIDPDPETLRDRWGVLVSASSDAKPLLLSEHKSDRLVDTVLTTGLDGAKESAPRGSIGEESGPCPEPIRIGYRTLDQQWIIPDKRLINRPSPELWAAHSEKQVYLTALDTESPTAGPAVSFTDGIPDHHHYKGSFAGRAYPLWQDSEALHSNTVPSLLAKLSALYDFSVSAADLYAYIACVAAHPDYTDRFREQLKNPGVRIPLTVNGDVFSRAKNVGGRVIWLHTYGRRFIDPSASMSGKKPRLPAEEAPKVLAGYPIPASSEEMPDALNYSASERVLSVGAGKIGNVPPEVVSYEASGMNVLSRWFSYRKKSREHPVMGDRRTSELLRIHSRSWTARYTAELLDLLHIIGLLVKIEPEQQMLLDEILSGELLNVSQLTDMGILPVPENARKAVKFETEPSEGQLPFSL
ncbi:type ISP restriction/modification enzyme [Streptomyces sp. NPDC060048]|uniref:type ISP restriction/modification enzyme n=1 Tax=unclassified Streptomyces TaxID=2593676 RepID=UPI00368EDC4A